MRNLTGKSQVRMLKSTFLNELNEDVSGKKSTTFAKCLLGIGLKTYSWIFSINTPVYKIIKLFVTLFELNLIPGSKSSGMCTLQYQALWEGRNFCKVFISPPIWMTLILQYIGGRCELPSFWANWRQRPSPMYLKPSG